MFDRRGRCGFLFAPDQGPFKAGQIYIQPQLIWDAFGFAGVNAFNDSIRLLIEPFQVGYIGPLMAFDELGRGSKVKCCKHNKRDFLAVRTLTFSKRASSAEPSS